MQILFTQIKYKNKNVDSYQDAYEWEALCVQRLFLGLYY